MSELQVVVTYAAFAAVILTIAFNILDLALAGLLGVSVLIVFGILTQGDIVNVVKTSGSTFALLFGGMIVARTLTASGIFEFLGDLFLRQDQRQRKAFSGWACHSCRDSLHVPSQRDHSVAAGAHYHSGCRRTENRHRCPPRSYCDYQQLCRIAHPCGGPGHIPRRHFYQYDLYRIPQAGQRRGAYGSPRAYTTFAPCNERCMEDTA